MSTIQDTVGKPIRETSLNALGQTEAPISVNTRVKSPNHFVYQITLRKGATDEDFSDLMNMIIRNEEKLLAKKWEPAVENRGGFTKQEVPTKPCPVHHVLMKERQGVNGKPNFFSHSRGIHPNLEWCQGSGFPSEKTQNAGSNEYEGGEF